MKRLGARWQWEALLATVEQEVKRKAQASPYCFERFMPA